MAIVCCIILAYIGLIVCSWNIAMRLGFTGTFRSKRGLEPFLPTTQECWLGFLMGLLSRTRYRRSTLLC